jgi:hypothetical protein
MVLLNRVVQVLRRSRLRIRGNRAIGFQLAHRTARCRVAIADRIAPRVVYITDTSEFDFAGYKSDLDNVFDKDSPRHADWGLYYAVACG